MAKHASQGALAQRVGEMSVEIGLEIAVRGAMEGVMASARSQDFGRLLTCTRHLQNLIVEAAALGRSDLPDLAREARAVIDGAVALVGGDGAAHGVGAPAGARAAYRSIEGLSL